MRKWGSWEGERRPIDSKAKQRAVNQPSNLQKHSFPHRNDFKLWSDTKADQSKAAKTWWDSLTNMFIACQIFWKNVLMKCEKCSSLTFKCMCEWCLYRALQTRKRAMIHSSFWCFYVFCGVCLFYGFIYFFGRVLKVFLYTLAVLGSFFVVVVCQV